MNIMYMYTYIHTYIYITQMYTYTYAYTYTHTYLALGAGVVSGAIRGCGNQHVGFYVNLGAYYGVALPAGLIFAFSLGLGLTGRWMGLCMY